MFRITTHFSPMYTGYYSHTLFIMESRLAQLTIIHDYWYLRTGESILTDLVRNFYEVLFVYVVTLLFRGF